MISKALKDVDLAVQAGQARAGQIAVLLDNTGKPAVFPAWGKCSRGELTEACLATRPASPGEVRMDRAELGHQWTLVIRKVRERNVVVVEGRVLAGIVADNGPAGKDAIMSGRNAETRSCCLVSGVIFLSGRNDLGPGSTRTLGV